MSEARFRLHSLDALRGVAALSVVAWHWQHFQLLGSPKLTWPPVGAWVGHKGEPFYPLLRLFYEQGYYAVDLFFVISGFIFFGLYQDKLAKKEISIPEFWVFRLSRLYPLHVVVLCLVAALQLVIRTSTRQFFIYKNNSLYAFFDSLFFVQQSGAGASFNGPEWSLTIEIVMYQIFCVLAWFGALRSLSTPLLVILAGMLIHYAHGEIISEGLCGFFVGGVAWKFFSWTRAGGRSGVVLPILTIIAAAGWATVLCDVYSGGWVTETFRSAAPFADPFVLAALVMYGLFPATVLVLALLEDTVSPAFGAVSWLGEISYSSYMVHFPLQLLFAVTVITGLVSADAVRSPMGMALYIAILIPLSLVVFRRFERPAQNALRSLWAKSRSGVAPARKQG